MHRTTIMAQDYLTDTYLRQFASHSLLIPWQTSPYALYKGVLCYPPPLKSGRSRASPEQRGE